MYEPSGDHTGASSCAGCTVSGTAVPPRAKTFQRSPRKLAASVEPSGEMTEKRSHNAAGAPSAAAAKLPASTVNPLVMKKGLALMKFLLAWRMGGEPDPRMQAD